MNTVRRWSDSRCYGTIRWMFRTLRVVYMIRNRLPFRFKWNSLFIKLLGSYVSLVMLLLSFTLGFFAYFSNNVQREIIRNNTLTLNHTVERYENHIGLIHNTIIQFYFNDKVLLLNELGHFLQFDPVNQVVDEIVTTTRNEFLYLDDIILQFRKNHFTIDKFGAGTPDSLFARYYMSEDYGVRFWQDQTLQSSPMTIFPQSDFTDSINGKTDKLMPVIIRNQIDDRLYIAALLQAENMFRAFYNPNQTRFYIYDDDGNELFRSTNTALNADIWNNISENEHVMQVDQAYYFYKKGEVTGLTYISVVPNSKIAEPMAQFRLVLISSFALVLAVSVLLSLILSHKFNSPIKKIMDAIQKLGSGRPLQSNINEYQFIFDKVNHFMQTNEHRRNTAELQDLRYMLKVKNINIRNKEDAEETKPFYLLLFKMIVTRHFSQLATVDQDRAIYFIMEYIKRTLSGHYADSVTLQMEKDLIMSLVFTEEELPGLTAVLQSLKQVFDQDKQYCRFTIAFQPMLRRQSGFTEAYDEALEIMNRRRLADTTQIITDMAAEPLFVGFSTAQEQEFLVHLQAGNESDIVAMLTRKLVQMEKMEATAQQFNDFSKEIIAKVIKTMITMKIDISTVFDIKSPYQNIRECNSLEDYIQLFERFLSKSVQLIQQKKSKQDPFKQAMIEYVNNHYSRDISLEMIADELGISIHYISKYFKEKTGMNFIDYVSQLRIQKSKELLLSTTLKVQDIARQTGYNSANSFIRMFRKYTGMAPGEYRKQHGIET